MERLEFKAVLYVVATAVTVAICVAALFVDFFLLNARRGSRACDGLTTCYVVSLGKTQIYRLYIYIYIVGLLYIDDGDTICNAYRLAVDSA